MSGYSSFMKTLVLCILLEVNKEVVSIGKSKLY
ncbi:hypothetical protein GLYMA_04G158133v4 [Glycine max]|nr:hypothetical protein GLYMA_04G158133v4 [Glycine max]KAH1111566.1 hypothetical protein GYH30_010091 [Glycine max]